MFVLLNAVAAVILGPVVLPAATVTDQRAELCEVMKGNYDTTAPDHCTGGDWARLIPYVVE